VAVPDGDPPGPVVQRTRLDAVTAPVGTEAADVPVDTLQLVEVGPLGLPVGHVGSSLRAVMDLAESSAGRAASHRRSYISIIGAESGLSM
jgi:hypothetical protein